MRERLSISILACAVLCGCPKALVPPEPANYAPISFAELNEVERGYDTVQRRASDEPGGRDALANWNHERVQVRGTLETITDGVVVAVLLRPEEGGSDESVQILARNVLGDTDAYRNRFPKDTPVTVFLKIRYNPKEIQGLGDPFFVAGFVLDDGGLIEFRPRVRTST